MAGTGTTQAQLAERMAWGPAWTDTGRVFTREDGPPLRPGWISQRFRTAIGRDQLPPIRLHDLRHGIRQALHLRICIRMGLGSKLDLVQELLLTERT
jgi:integrase